MAHLVITSGQLEGRRIEVSRELVVGRENVDVEIDDAELSRRHFAVRPVAGGLEVEDLGSRNGTRVDGTRIDGPTRVRHGAVVTVGVTMLTVEAPQEAPASSAGETRAHVSEGTVVGQAPPRPARRPAPPPPAPAAPPAPRSRSGRGRPRRRRRDAAVRALPGIEELAPPQGRDAAVGATGADLRQRRRHRRRADHLLRRPLRSAARPARSRRGRSRRRAPRARRSPAARGWPSSSRVSRAGARAPGRRSRAARRAGARRSRRR